MKAETIAPDVRSHFPALERIHNGKPVAYFDGPGGTQTARVVIDAVRDYYLRHNANDGWAYPTSAETDAIVSIARDETAQFLGAKSGKQIVFGANMTTLAYHLSRTIARDLKPGDEILVTELDHHGNVDPWREAAADFGLTVIAARMNAETCDLDYDDLLGKIGARTRVIAIGAASNAFGTINDVARVARKAREAGAICVVDAVHYAAHRSIDVEAIGCDFLLCSTYKFYGPHAGVLYGRDLDAYRVPRLQPQSAVAPQSWETGTKNFEAIAGIAATFAFMGGLESGETRRHRIVAAYQAFEEKEQRQFAHLWDGLNSLPRVRTYGLDPSGPRTPTVAFTVEGVAPRDVAAHLANDAIFASSGGFYAQAAIAKVRPQGDGLVRLGIAWYTTDEDVDRVIESLGRLSD